jgi:hypothetical protein
MRYLTAASILFALATGPAVASDVYALTAALSSDGGSRARFSVLVGDGREARLEVTGDPGLSFSLLVSRHPDGDARVGVSASVSSAGARAAAGTPNNVVPLGVETPITVSGVGVLLVTVDPWEHD